MKLGVNRCLRPATGLWLVLALSGGAVAAEWPHWRGPRQDGTSVEKGLVSSWSTDGSNLLWKAEFTGRSTPVVFDERVCVIGRVGDGIDRQERVACYEAGSGRLLWEDRFNVYHTTVPFNRVGWASLAADPETGHLYAHGVAGQLICYAPDGRIVWSHFLTEAFGRYSGYGGRTQTPLIEDDFLIISFVNSSWGDQAALRHRYFAFDKRNGELVWVSTPGGRPYDFNTQSSPVATTIGGRRLIVAGNADGWVYALLARTGEKIWGFQLSKRGLNSSVLVQGDRVFASHSEENIDTAAMGRVVCVDGTGEGDVTKTHEVWRNDDISSGFPSPAYHDGRLYVVDNSANLYSLDPATGSIQWTHSLGTVGKGSPAWADGKLYVTEVNGNFHILKPGEGGVRSLDVEKLEVEGGRYAEIYGSPAIAYGRIYFTTEGGLYCLGDGTTPVRPTLRAVDRGRGITRGKGETAWLQVVPGEVLIRPGETVRLELRALDGERRSLGAVEASWSLDGLEGSVGADGTFTADAGTRFQAGRVVARVGKTEAATRVRVVDGLPWSEDCDSLPEGKSPAHWIGAAGKFVAAERDGEKVLRKAPRERGLNRSALYMGPSSLSNYTITADVLGTQQGRRRADVGLVAGGYILDLMGAHQKLEIRSWTSELRMARETPFSWEMDRWYRMKLRVETGPDAAIIRGKVWPRGEPEPEDWTLTAQDPHPIAGGSPGLVAYTPVDAYYDNIQVTPNP
jgi:outer membrane protein assembly factor BamB